MRPLTTGVLAMVLVAPAIAADFASVVHGYAPAPGQFINNGQFNDPSRALGPPVGGGTAAPDHSKVVSLGGVGGSITLGFDDRVLDDPRNPMGLDCIVFGNAFWAGNDPTRRYGEAAVIEISRDDNGNGAPDDAWFVVRGSSLPPVPDDALHAQAWDNDPGTPTPPANALWYPSQAWYPGFPSSYTTTAHLLPQEFAAAIIVHPAGPGATEETHWGYADLSPTLLLGDTDGDNAVDEPAADAASFYTVPDNPLAIGVDPGCGGGDAFDIAWAVHPATGGPAGLDGFDFIRITTAVHFVSFLGETSAEIGGVADVRPLPGPSADINGDGEVDGLDLGLLLGAWGTGSAEADLNGDGLVDGLDLGLLLGVWGGGS